MTISAGLLMRSRATISDRPASAPRTTRICGREAFSITATGMVGARPSAISFSAMAAAVATPM
jgi:hypothetical protein